jgi:Flp pilus assembly CpaE family ATPase
MGIEGQQMSSGVSTNLDMNYPDFNRAGILSIALIGPDTHQREAVAAELAKWPGAEVREFPAYPPSLEDVPRLLELAFDVILVDVDSDPEYAIRIVECICARDSATVMVYSSTPNQDLEAHCRRAGAREFLNPPYDQGNVAEALVRAAALGKSSNHDIRQNGGKLLVFFGAKGGSGTTTLACNYAVALAHESRQRTLLIDLGWPLGDGALNLGIAAEHSTEDALKDAEHLDPSYLESLVAKHDSGVSVLAAPSRAPETSPNSASVDKLLAVARATFDYVIVDVGSRVDLMNTALFNDSHTIYMVTQAGISELRNADRLITRYFNEGNKKLEIVINRYNPTLSRVTEDQMTKALGRPVRWKIPDDDDATRLMQNPDALQSNSNSGFLRLLVEMANSANDYAVHQAPRDDSQGSAGTIDRSDHSPDAADSNNGGSPSKSSAAPSNPGGLPTVVWSTPDGIIYGTALSEHQLNATASVPGTFVYTPAFGYVLPVGTHTLWVTFTAESGPTVQSAVSIGVQKAMPSITWPVPRPISCDTQLSDLQLNATASVPGTLEYSPALDNVLAAGEHALSVTFHPADEKNYTSAKATVSITVEKLVPSIAWSAPDKLPYGGALSARHLNATASVPGTFHYSPSAGEVMEPGEHTLSVTFTPADQARFATAQATVMATVMKAPPRVTWTTPDPIIYGTPLSPGQLNATASVEGTFVYKPGLGTVLAVGEHTPSVIFTPNDNSEYSSIQAAVPLSVVMAKPVISWATPESIACGTPLSAAELNATATVAGTFAYKPALGEVLKVGTQTLSVTFIPVDTMNYEPAKATVSLAVTELNPAEITWPAPAAVSYGTAIGEIQLNATASVPGKFVYGPGAGDVLPAGKHTLSVMFTPANTRKNAIAQATVTLVVEPLPDIASLLVDSPQNQSGRDVTMENTSTAEDEREVMVPGRGPAERQESEGLRARAASARKEQAGERASTRPETPKGPDVPAREKSRETRTYKGVIYEKGDDGQWHRQQN